MTKIELKNLAEKAIIRLQKMFGENVEFSCVEYCKTNEALTSIAFKLPSYPCIPLMCLDDLLENTSAEEVAEIAADAIREALRNPELSLSSRR